MKASEARSLRAASLRKQTKEKQEELAARAGALASTLEYLPDNFDEELRRAVVEAVRLHCQDARLHIRVTGHEPEIEEVLRKQLAIARVLDFKISDVKFERDRIDLAAAYDPEFPSGSKDPYTVLTATVSW